MKLLNLPSDDLGVDLDTSGEDTDEDLFASESTEESDTGTTDEVIDA